MNFAELIKKHYPDTEWLAATDIHRSFSAAVLFTLRHGVTLSEALNLGGIDLEALAADWWEYITGQLPDTAWMIDQNDFKTFLVASYMLQANGEPPPVSDDMLVNPETGSWYVVIGTKHELTVGVRFYGFGNNREYAWQDFKEKARHLAFRVRVEAKIKSDDQLTKELESVLTQSSKISIPEPMMEPVKRIKERLH